MKEGAGGFLVTCVAGETNLRSDVIEASVRSTEVDGEDVEFIVEFLLFLIVIVVLLQPITDSRDDDVTAEACAYISPFWRHCECRPA